MVKQSKLMGALLATGLILAVLLAAHPASADGLCTSMTSCVMTLDQTNAGFSGGTPVTGDFGTVTLTLNTTTDVATVDVKLDSGFQIIKTGFPGSFGFVDDLGGGLTIGNFSSASYSGSASDATNDQHFDGFGYSNDAAATTGPHASSGIQEVTFTVSDGTKLTDVNALVNLFNPAGGDGPSYFVVDAYDGNTGDPSIGGKTGLLSVTGNTPTTTAPEPSTLSLLGAGILGLAMIGFSRQRVTSR